jgi:ribosomal protein S18 acetylase RimI-like enzyme
MTAQNSPLSIRKATQHDIAAIQDIAYKTWPSAYGEILTPESLNYMLGYFYATEALQEQMQNGQEFFIAELNHSPIGFASISKYSDEVYKLNKLYVLPDVQKSGAGKNLMDHCIEVIRSYKATQLVLNVNRNNSAKGFYERIGFSILREEDVDLGNGVLQEDYVMIKDI